MAKGDTNFGFDSLRELNERNFGAEINSNENNADPKINDISPFLTLWSIKTISANSSFILASCSCAVSASDNFLSQSTLWKHGFCKQCLCWQINSVASERTLHSV